MKSALMFGCLLAASQALFGQAAATSSIEGQVVNQLTGAPIPRATLSLRLIATMRETRPGEPPRNINSIGDVEGDAQGRFVFQNLEAGGYLITVERQGFLGGRTGIGGYSGPSQLFLGEAQHFTGYLLRLMPQSIITGKVVDSDGDPVVGSQVAALRWGYSNGVRQLMRVPMSATATTNDLGEYRLPGLPAGSYYVEAALRNRSPRNVAPDQPLPDEPRRIYVTTYHPGATEPTAAESVRVEAGVEVAGIDIKLTKTRVFSIRGKVVDPEAPPGRRASASLRPRKLAVPSIFTANPTLSSADGTFAISGVPPGSYDLVAQRTDTAATDPTATAVLPIEVRDRNLDGITVKLVPSFDVQGVVKLAPAAQCDASGMTVGLSPAPGISYGGYVQAAQIGSGSKFTLKNVGPFTYAVNLMNSGPCYVQSVQYGGKEVADSGVSMDGTGSLEITLARSSATVQGSVVDAAGEFLPHALVTLMRKGGPSSSFRQSVASSADFTFSSLPPGTYEVFAWERVDTSAARSPEFLKLFESHAKVVMVEADGRTGIQLTAIPASETTDPDPPVPAQPPQAKGSLEGRVVEAGSDAPLQYAIVVLRHMSFLSVATFNGRPQYVAEAGEEGRFAFPDLEPGSYSIQARRPGFVAVGAAGSASPMGELLIVGEGQRIANYVLRMSPH